MISRGGFASYYLVALAVAYTDIYRQSCSENQACLPLSQCDDVAIDKLVQSIQGNAEARQHLKKKNCGFEGKEAKVCCSQTNVMVDVINMGVGVSQPIVDYEETATCGSRSTFSFHITGGEETAPGDWPWMALLRYSDPVWRCAGVLISSRHVLTAAHCVTDNLQEVILGEHDLSTTYDCLDPEEGCEVEGDQCEAAQLCGPPPLLAEISNSTIHPRYKKGLSYAEFDVAVLTLSRRVQFSQYIRPVCLPSSQDEDYGRLPVTVLGWGVENTSYFSDQLSNTLKKLELSQIPLWDCNEIYKIYTDTDLKPSHYCATSGVLGSSACRGDSGGPLVRELQSGLEYEVAGVMSLGSKNCGNIDIPLLFTRVEGEVNTWIRRMVGERELPRRPMV